MTITFVDAGVLIAAARGTPEVSAQAIAILDDPERTFEALFNKRLNEAEFYNSFFQAVSHWSSDTNALVKHAYEIAARYRAREICVPMGGPHVTLLPMRLRNTQM